MKKILLTLVTLLGLSLFLASCGGSTEQRPEKSTTSTSTNTDQHKPYIGIVIKARTNEFWKVIETATQRYIEDNKDTLQIEIAGIQNEVDIDQQIQLVENFIEKQIDMLVLAPASSTKLIPSIKHAMQAGIKVVIFDVRLDEEAAKIAGLDYTFVGPDNRRGSREVGTYMAEKFLKPHDKVIIIEGNPGAANAIERRDGYMDVIKKYKLDLVASETAHWETEEAYMVMAKLLHTHPDVKAVFSANDSMVVGIHRALKEAGLLGKVKVVGFDNIPSTQELMRSGNTVVASEEFYGPQLAINAVKTALKKYHRKEVPHWVRTPVKLVTANHLKND